jgi:4-carboxymuconolactone decarboxylase
MDQAVPTPRILPLEPPYAGETGATLEKMMPPGMAPLKLFRTIARNPEVLKNFALNGALIYRNSSLDPLDRETVIHRTCARCGSEYEWGVHAAMFAARVGLGNEQVKATVLGSAMDPAWSPRQRLLVRLVDELHDTSHVSSNLWQEMAALWTESQLLELLVLVGFYHTVAFITNGVGIAQEEFAAKFPAS